MLEDRRLTLAGILGAALPAAAVVSDLLVGSFWQRHGLTASILANVLVLAVTVVVVNELLERRARSRWQLLAQRVLFSFVQAARATWTGIFEVLELGEVRTGSVEPLIDAAGVARDLQRVSEAARSLLEDSERRLRLQRLTRTLSDHAADLIAKWAPVMVGTGPYASALNRHVELADRVEWLHTVLAHNEPADRRSPRERAIVRGAVVAERAEELSEGDWVHDQILAVVRLATELDEQSREHGFALASREWWDERTAGLIAEEERSAAGTRG